MPLMSESLMVSLVGASSIQQKTTTVSERGGESTLVAVELSFKGAHIEKSQGRQGRFQNDKCNNALLRIE